MQKKTSDNNSKLILKTFTWERDSHGLYDFEGININEAISICSTEGMLIRKGQSISLCDHGKTTTDGQALIKISHNDGEYKIHPCPAANDEEYNSGLWKLIRPFKSNLIYVLFLAVVPH